MPATICEPPSTAAPGTARSWCAVAGFLLLSTLPAAAGSMESVSLYEQYKALSNDPKYKWAGAITVRSITGQEATASCVAVAPTIAIGAGHFTPGVTSSTIVKSITFGQNYKTGEGLVMEADRWERFQGYVVGDASTTDLGVYYLTQPIPGFTPVTFVTETPPLGTILTMVDYGNYGDTTTGELPSLGDRLAGRAVVSDYGLAAIAGYPLSKYGIVNFQSNSGAPTFSLRTQGLQFSSGSPWFDANGRLAFLTIALINGQMTRYTICLRLNLPEVQAWLQPKIAASWEALSPELTPAITAGQFRVTWDAAATGWTLHASDTLGSWTPLGPALTGPGFHEEPLATRRFFRLQRP